MSIGFLLNDPRDSVVWRGPKKNAMIRQFLVDVCWGELDGTSDEHISLLEQLSPLLTHQPQDSSNSPLPSLSSVLVTTPQAVSLLDVSKEYDFTKKTGLRVLGLIENMSGFLCPHCDQVQNIFGSGGGLSFCEKVSASSSSSNQNQHQGEKEKEEDRNLLQFLGKIPIDVEFMKLMDQASNPENLTNNSSSIIPSNSLLIDRYFNTKTSTIFAEICQRIVHSVTRSTSSSS
ncbi:hypothetical protein H4Q26_004799 [Puccinia striiformis f. sp. tritici PST-130]|nr:hypothetical protein H4Q26_004799 [Puccinia striiformis f. sp. tritici PST-130]